MGGQLRQAGHWTSNTHTQTPAVSAPPYTCIQSSRVITTLSLASSSSVKQQCLYRGYDLHQHNSSMTLLPPFIFKSLTKVHTIHHPDWESSLPPSCVMRERENGLVEDSYQQSQHSLHTMISPDVSPTLHSSLSVWSWSSCSPVWNNQVHLN